MKRKFRLKYIFIIVITLFVLWNLCWFTITTIQYHKYVKAVPKNKWGTHAIRKGNYTYSVKKPDYLSFTGNLAVSREDQKDKMEDLIIWPTMTGGYKYGVRLQENGEAYEIYVNEKLEPVDKSDAIAKKVIMENKEDLKTLFSNANKVWDLNE
ncbi:MULTISPECIES: hypothetical protein [Heyndrickxia]|uniref:hypothetical protein n=1 Tax=Heyndrickxia TaxID=2837504 RepID=UPI000CE29212|nr:MULTISPECIES: hypothetical protein [Heyndrickxia]AVD54719.1 hypothetical protein C3766_00205 [Heyndrickxia coagulans]AWP35563.1 hypothetical protein CYJ15_00215 [Heyndrickxia coagulans]MED4839334.1 hypothetical protein [Weizmannia sp. CD-2023]MED4901810.1 hypothetical protein [Weizmannia sp. CD-2023]MED4922037.1 hypothetical protein [Weizmannia sp. CD-2023]